MPAAPLPDQEAQRLEALLSCRILDTPTEQRFDDLTALASRLCQAPIALVSLVDRDRQWFKSRHGLDAEETPRGAAFCGYAILQDEPLIINNAADDPRTADNPLVLGGPKIRFYAGVPLKLSQGEAVGTLCVIDTKPRELSQGQIDDLQALAQQAASQLELNRVNDQLIEALDAERKANHAKSSFLANMSHEIRTPLTAILGYTDMLIDGASSESDRDTAANTIQRNSQHLLALVNDILDVSKIEAGKLELQQVETSLLDLLPETVQLFGPLAAAKGLSLNIQIDGEVPDTIRTDPTRVKQALFNLVGNATKFTEAGSITITARHDAESRRLELAVRDTGVGLSTSQIEMLFEPFSQVDSSATRRVGGTGLGLTITREIATLLGGSVSVTSEPGKGSTFALTVDCGDVAHRTMIRSIDSAKTKSAASTGRETQRTIQGHVLVVEDGVDNQRLIEHILKKAGATVTIRENGLEGMETALKGDAEGQPFDLVLMDMHMPIMSGYEAATKLREHGYAGQIIALTANALSSERDICLQAGCDEYLTKPIERPRFMAVVADHIGKPSTRREKPDAA